MVCGPAKEGKSKFGDKPLRKIKVESDDPPSRAFVAEDDFEIIRKERKEPDFGIPNQQHDPLISDFAPHDELDEDDEEERFPVQPQSQPQPFKVQPQVNMPRAAPNVPMTKVQPEVVTEIEVQEPQEEKLDVIVLNVHCAGNQPLSGPNCSIACSKMVCYLVKWIFSIATRISPERGKC